MNQSLPPSLSAVALSQLLVTKLCHDVANPIGAINNGMELLEEDESMREAAMELIGNSAASAGARIQFYRYIFGMLKGEGIVDMRDKKALVEGFYKGSKIEVVWQSCPETMLQSDCQILCNLLTVAASVLLRGGVVTIDAKAAAEDVLDSLTITVSGTHLKMDEETREALLDHPRHDPTTKSVQAFYTALLVEEQGGKVTLEINETTAHFRYEAKAH